MKYIYLSLLFLALLLWSFKSTAQVQLLNDEFDEPQTMANWMNINDYEGWHVTQLETINIHDSSSGQLFLRPYTQGWFAEYRGALLFKFIEGDFVATTEVTTTARDGNSLPSSDFSLAGIMVREPLHYPNQDPSMDWLPNQQNFIFMSIGQAQGPGYDFEIKNTCHSNSCLDIVPINTNRALIRMARIGQVVIVPLKVSWRRLGDSATAITD